MVRNHENLKDRIEGKLKEIVDSSIKVNALIPTGGGCVNETFLVESNQMRFFLKLNRSGFAQQMFAAEVRGLNLLRQCEALLVPVVVGQWNENGCAFLLLEYLQKAEAGSAFWQNFGQNLAALHRISQSGYGLDHDNYIGTLKQQNTPSDEWASFYIEQRLRPQLRLAQKFLGFGGTRNAQFERLFTRLPSLLPIEKPSLLHGDLWSGNFLATEGAIAALFDPAVYFGNREVDLAMSKLFGSFDSEFYQAYDEAFPLEQGWRARIDIYQLYPLLVHLNLFGRSYLDPIDRILARLSA